MDIAVVFTNFEETELALRQARKLSAGLHPEIGLIVAQVVPFPLPLTEPPVPIPFTMVRMDGLADAADVQPSIHVYLCRDKYETLAEVLQPHSLIIVGSRKRWFRRRPERLVTMLRKRGHNVILASRN